MASYKKNKDGWAVRISRNVDGQRIQKYKTGFPTKTAAKDYAMNFEQIVVTGKVNQKSITFPSYYDEWFELYKKQKISPITANRYLIISKKLHEHFDKINIKKMNRRRYQKFINLYGKNHAPETVKKLNSIVRSCVRSAIYDDLISKDFTQNVTLSWNKDKELAVEYLSLGEISTLVKETESKLNPHFTSRFMILTAIYSGARLGEIQALTWKDINFNWKTISINKSWNIKESVSKETKTEGSNRIIRVNQELLDILNLLKSNGNSMVFENQYHTIPTSNAVNRHSENYLKNVI